MAAAASGLGTGSPHQLTAAGRPCEACERYQEGGDFLADAAVERKGQGDPIQRLQWQIAELTRENARLRNLLIASDDDDDDDDSVRDSGSLQRQVLSDVRGARRILQERTFHPVRDILATRALTEYNPDSVIVAQHAAVSAATVYAVTALFFSNLHPSITALFTVTTVSAKILAEIAYKFLEEGPLYPLLLHRIISNASLENLVVKIVTVATIAIQAYVFSQIFSLTLGQVAAHYLFSVIAQNTAQIAFLGAAALERKHFS